MRASSNPPAGLPVARKRRRIVAVLVAAAVCVGGLELGARVVDRVRGAAWNGEGCRDSVREACAVLSRRAYIPGGLHDEARAIDRAEGVIVQPYTGWEHMSTQSAIVAGREYYATQEAAAAYDVCILGGSVAQTIGEHSVETLADVLKTDARFRGRTVRVHNYACAGYKQPQPLMFLSYLLAMGHKPDAVIEIDGFNDAALSWTNARSGANPAYPYLPGWAHATNGLRLDWDMTERLHELAAEQDRARAFGEWFVDSGLWRSCFLGHACKSRFERLRRDYVDTFKALLEYLKARPQDFEVKGPRFADDDQAIADAIVAVWEECSRSMHGLCAERDITYLHVMQPALHFEGSKPLTAAEIAGAAGEASWIEGVRRLYPSLRSVGARLAQRGVAFFDATQIFREHPEDIYTDLCHLNQHGRDMLADAIAHALLGALPKTDATR